jgi:pilus assembly protein CpaB
VRNWRVLTAVAAVGLALVAAVASYSYVTGADERAQSNEETVDVLQAKTTIPRGMKASDAAASGMIAPASVPRKLVPPNAVQDAEALGDQIALAPISEGQFVTADSFVTATEAVVSGGFAASLKKDTFAMQIQLDQTRSLAGFLVPGDRVNVIVTADVDMVETSDAAFEQNEDMQTTGYLIPGLKVLAIGATTAEVAAAAESEGGDAATVETTNQGLLTVEVTARQALQLAHAQMGGANGMYLTLTPTSFDPEKFEIPDEIVKETNLFDQQLEQWLEVARRAPAQG